MNRPQISPAAFRDALRQAEPVYTDATEYGFRQAAIAKTLFAALWEGSNYPDAILVEERAFWVSSSEPDIDIIPSVLFAETLLDWIEWVASGSPGAQDQKGFVYFVEAVGLARVKIGFSDDPPARLRQLATGSAVPLKLLAQTPGTVALEKQLHNRFGHLRIEGEWFHATRELLDFIAGGKFA